MPITVHHLHVSSSERVVWLCEELGVPYELKKYRRAPLLAPPEYKALHPTGASPVIQDGPDLTLAESAACIEYIAHKHGGGRLFLKPEEPAYPAFLYWWYWSAASFQPTVMRASSAQASGQNTDNPMVQISLRRFKKSLEMLNARLENNEWLAGNELTAADIYIVFSLTTLRYFFPFSLGEYGNIVRYLSRVGEREAYQRAMRKGDPEMELALGAEPPKKISM